MKSKAKQAARSRSRRPALTLTQRVERLERDLLFAAKAPPAPISSRFTRLDANGKPTTGDHVAVHDASTGLTWSAGPLLGGKELTHADAMKACSDLDLMGHRDWRAPTIQELLSIVDYERFDPAVDTEVFKGPYGWTWSSTLAKSPAGYAWGVLLSLGGSGHGHQDNHSRVRAVRAGQQ